jgi:hypothetical protein
MASLVSKGLEVKNKLGSLFGSCCARISISQRGGERGGESNPSTRGQVTAHLRF